MQYWISYSKTALDGESERMWEEQTALHLKVPDAILPVARTSWTYYSEADLHRTACELDASPLYQGRKQALGSGEGPD